MRTALCSAGVLALWCGTTLAQTPTTSDRLDQLEQRLNQTQTDLKNRDDEVARLKAEVTQLKQSSTAPTPPATDEIEKTRQDVLKDIDSRSSSPLTLRNPVSFN